MPVVTVMGAMVRGRRQWLLAPVAAVALLLTVSACRADVPRPEPVSFADGSTTAPPTESPQLGLGKAPAPPAVEESTGSAPTPRPRPQSPPPPEEPIPPPPPPRTEGECIASRDGPDASPEEVAAALTEAAGRTYWPISAPEIRVPLALVKAVAWQESGWQADVIACDGGIGVMQVMPDTATFVNQRFEVSYDVDTLTGNVTLGANYLAWLTKYFGDVHFDGVYQLRSGDCADHVDPCLLNAVIAAYNFGPGAVEDGDGLTVPNPQYVESVRALMTSCPCLSL